jgi:hypothetical protein
MLKLMRLPKDLSGQGVVTCKSLPSPPVWNPKGKRLWDTSPSEHVKQVFGLKSFNVRTFEKLRVRVREFRRW